jgi:serine/threonine protein kinase/tetratricopeptide (TPR) repeat protein
MTHNYREGDELISGYRLVRFLGRGGFGEVWKATAPGGAEVALKIIRLGGAEGGKEFRALQLVKRVRHPNLIPVNAFWLKSADGAVLAGEFAEMPDLPGARPSDASLHETLMAPTVTRGPQAAELIIAMGLGDKSLFDRFEECRSEGRCGIPEEELLGYMEDAARAIDFLNSPVHDPGSGPVAIQHCDIKPHNLLIVGDAVEVCDFGLARMLGADRATTAAASIAYAAPECLEEGKPSAATDQYSLAVSYCEMRSGKLPYGTETMAAVVEAKCAGQLDLSMLSPAERTVMARATARNPADRYPSASAMVKALREAARGELADTRPMRWRSKSRRLSAVALTAVLLVAGLAVAMSLPWHSDEEPRPPADKVEQEAARESLATPAGPEVKAPPAPLVSASSIKPPAPAIAKTGSPVPDAAKPMEKGPPKPVAAAPSADALLARGTEYLKNRRYDEAVAAFTEVVRLTPRDARVYSRLGVAQFAQGRFQDAVDDFTAAIRLEPDARDLVNRGRAYRALEKLAEAEADFAEAIRLDPRSAPAHFFRGELYQNAKQYAKAADDFGKAIELASGKPAAGFTLAAAYERRGLCRMLPDTASSTAVDEAVSDFDEALRLDPENPADLHEFRAAAFELQGKAEASLFDNQMAALFKRIRATPDDADAYRRLALMLASCPVARLRDGKKAVELATRACELTSWTDSMALDSLASAHAAADNRAGAVEFERKAVEAEKDPAVKEAFRTRLKRYEAQAAQNATSKAGS